MDPNITQSKYLSVADAAKFAGGVCERTIRNRITSGELPAVRFGRRILVRRADLEALLEGSVEVPSGKGESGR